MKPNDAGFARVDIDPNGKGCHTVWTNKTVASNVCGHLATPTGLYYTVARVVDKSQQDPVRRRYGLDVYYWTALDFRAGKVVQVRCDQAARP